MTASSDRAARRADIDRLVHEVSANGPLSEAIGRLLDTRLTAFERRLSRQLEDSLSAAVSGAVAGALNTVLPDALRPAGHLLAPSVAGAFLGSVLPGFAAGGIVDGPSVIGLAGEAGPEAVVPLARGPDGRLGVALAGGSDAPPVPAPPVVIIQTRGPDAAQEDTASTADTADLVDELTSGLSSDLTIDTLEGLSSALHQAVGAAVTSHLTALLDERDEAALPVRTGR